MTADDIDLYPVHILNLGHLKPIAIERQEILQPYHVGVDNDEEHLGSE